MKLIISLVLLLAVAANARKYLLPDRFVGKSVFVEFYELLQKYKPLDLGSGSPQSIPPPIIQKTLAQAALSDDYTLSQYAPGSGHPRLLDAVAKFYSKHLNRTLDPNGEILVTVDATEALFDAFQAFTFPGDEWIVIEPFFEPLVFMIKAAQGVPKYVSLKPKKTDGISSSADWTFDKEEFASLFNERTRGVVLNSPNNPIGKMLNYEELSFISELVQKWDGIVISDEVYEFMTFDDNEHIRIATVPGMFERTITIGTAGKIFGATGYMIGWAFGHKDLIDNVKALHTMIVSSVATPLQEAIAAGFEKEIEDFGKPNSFVETHKREAVKKRDFLVKMLANVGAKPIIPEGGYYVVADVSTLHHGQEVGNGIFSLAEWMMKNIKVTGMPMAGFFSEKNRHLGLESLRFTILKDDETLKKAEKILVEYKSQHQ